MGKALENLMLGRKIALYNIVQVVKVAVGSIPTRSTV